MLEEGGKNTRNPDLPNNNPELEDKKAEVQQIFIFLDNILTNRMKTVPFLEGGFELSLSIKDGSRTLDVRLGKGMIEDVIGITAIDPKGAFRIFLKIYNNGNVEYDYEGRKVSNQHSIDYFLRIWPSLQESLSAQRNPV